MRYIGDFHIHSKYSRATSKDMNIEELDKWARIKGIDVLGTGDFTHPKWFRELEEKLEPAEEGLFKLKDATKRGQAPLQAKKAGPGPALQTRFILTVEVSSIYSQGGKVRRIHNIVFAPSFEVARKINRRLSEVGNLRADGRPILGLPAKELLKIVLNASEDCLLVPAHAWTPWFSIFGSKSGFDSIEECFGDMAKYVYAIESGLSSDPAMNWRLSALDNITLISNSDCHSARRIGREANIFEGDELSCKNIIDAIKYSRRQNVGYQKSHMRLVETVEFFPEEGKYHYDGHRACGISFHPRESQKTSAVCPKCDGPLTIGVLSRVEELADRPPFDPPSLLRSAEPRKGMAEGHSKSTGDKPEGAIPFRSLIPLDEIIAEALGVSGTQTKRVLKEYNNLIEKFGTEFKILLDISLEELKASVPPAIFEAIHRVRERDLYIEPGYDGEYGKVKIFKEGEKRPGKEQKTLSVFSN